MANEKHDQCIDHGVLLFSPKFGGSIDTWNWLCEISNGRKSERPLLNDSQIHFAISAGYLPLFERENIKK